MIRTDLFSTWSSMVQDHILGTKIEALREAENIVENTYGENVDLVASETYQQEAESVLNEFVNSVALSESSSVYDGSKFNLLIATEEYGNGTLLTI